MGRRALRKIDPNIDLSPWLIEGEELPHPFVPSEFFGRQAPLEVEVGSGKGLFLASMAEDCPEHNVLGIEIARKYAKHAAYRVARTGSPHVKVVRSPAEPIFADLLAANSVHAVHVYFPDPWWKARHRRRRVMQNEFLRDIERVLMPGGRLHFWTDVEEYYHSALETIAASTTLSGPHPVPETLAEHDLDYRTHFERRMRMHNLPIWRSEFVKETG